MSESKLAPKPLFIVAHDGHVFAVKYEPRGMALLTNEYGCQTRMNYRHAIKLLIKPTDKRVN